MKKLLNTFLLALAACTFQNCQSNTGNSALENDTLAVLKAYDSSPVLSAEESLKHMQVEEGFEVKLVAAEPLVNTPVAMTFDGKGRMWVLEMENFMTDIEGSKEHIPNGKIAILEDKNGDGIADERKVFMDSLVLPRAICLIENGILVAEPPKLWFVEIQNDKASKKTLVDETYAEGGNAESQANGLYRALDNWIYNGGLDKRYRKKGDKWLIERTHYRGQWGISQDNYGRLYYNNNSQNLLGDYFAPGLGAGNENQEGIAGYNEKIVADNKVYPARPTPGVNRGYREGTLDEQLRLVSFTAACGPVIYRGNLFPAPFANNAFVAEPAANLIKRNILENTGYSINGKQAYAEKEFLASVDERFRPVSLYNGPDGALYVVDMYRGIIQYKLFLTEYLKTEISKRQLSQPTSYGRIYKIVPKNKTASQVILPKDPEQLVKLLAHSNGWVRDRAQQILIDGKFSEAIPSLKETIKQTNKPLAVIHSLWTLEGLNALSYEDVLPLLKHSHWPIQMQALTLLPHVINQKNHKQLVVALEQLVREQDTLAAPYIGFIAKSIEPFDATDSNRLLKLLIELYPNNIYVSDAVLSNLKNRESHFYRKVVALNPDTSQIIHTQFKKVMADIENAKKNKDVIKLQKAFPRGVALFRSTCQPCHGADGNGVQSLAPPLNHSEWVTGDKDKLISIILYGLTGPVQVNGTVYKAPQISGDMPGIGNNKDLVDEDIAQLLSFIRNSWTNTAEKVSADDVVRVRKKYSGRQKAFTVEELENK